MTRKQKPVAVITLRVDCVDDPHSFYGRGEDFCIDGLQKVISFPDTTRILTVSIFKNYQPGNHVVPMQIVVTEDEWYLSYELQVKSQTKKPKYEDTGAYIRVAKKLLRMFSKKQFRPRPQSYWDAKRKGNLSMNVTEVRHVEKLWMAFEYEE